MDPSEELSRHGDATPVPIALSAWTDLVQEDLLHANPTAENLRRPVADVQLYDALDDQANVRNAVVLAMGVSCGSVGFERVLVHAADGEAAAVIVKARGTPIEELRAASSRHDVPVLVVGDDADWTRLIAMARTAVAGAAVDSVSGVRLGDLFAFANAVASIANGAASIVDPSGRILGYSTVPGQPIDDLRRETTLTLQERTPPALDADFKVVYASTDALFVQSPSGIRDRLALAVRAGGELLGSIWIIDPGGERRQSALDALDRLAPLAGLHMLHARSASDFTERRNADLMRTLMDDPAQASFAAAQLGLEFTDGFAIAAFALTHPNTGSLDAMREQHRLLQLVTVTCNVQFRSAYSALIDSVVYALLPCAGESPRAAHRRVIRDIGSYATTISAHPVVAAVGGIAEQIGELPRSRTEAVRTLQYLMHQQSVTRENPTLHPPAAAVFEDYWTELNLLEIGTYIAEKHLGRFDVIDAIRAYDAAHHTDFLITLRAYFDSNASVSTAADRMHVHGNTIRYRITRVAEEFGIDFDNPTTRLWLWLRLVSADLR
ncbi:PucR-like helix-turn-helix protein [Rhodococcus wratislaviensis]|uniref:CdaR family transcriptional regulator n=1 Tax=Rhodococcus wratislaviensis TaxID=44752 RepID=A0AB38F7I6_RHOWR|nr:PucR family transcriptional regulator [Rhodococcus wratislaviensis]REE77427.1 PucR-like helix-turn-helix protein [Rhodococcus wratislaviensis]SPZ35530.1 putative CdaR family transcriptional regulator [Rhodococcus wratislaviensis]